MVAQEAPIPQLTPGSARKLAPASSVASARAPLQSVALSIPTGTPLQVALDQEIHVKKVGQPIHRRIVEAVYAFDHIVIPIGSEVTGQVTKIGEISGEKRTAAALDANFTPERKVEVNFDDLVLAGGRRFRLQSSVTPGSGQAIQLVSPRKARKRKRRQGCRLGENETGQRASPAAMGQRDEAAEDARPDASPDTVH